MSPVLSAGQAEEVTAAAREALVGAAA
jgi:hypothetical protein